MATIEETLKTDIAFKTDFIKSSTGDLDIISGLENVKEALYRRLVTTPGSLIHRPTYGVGIKLYQNSVNTIESQRKMALAIKEEFEQDSRVEKVLGVSVDSKDKTPDLIQVMVRVKIVGYGETTFGFIPFGDV